MLQHVVDHTVKDYNLLVMGNKSLLSKRSELKCCCKDLQAALAEARSNVKKRVVDLRAKVKSMEAHGEKCFRDFEDRLVRRLDELCWLYVGTIQTIDGLCS
jgi:hypothetical protein